MSNPELKTVPVPRELFEKVESYLYGRMLDGSSIALTLHRALNEAASPPPPVAGDEGAERMVLMPLSDVNNLDEVCAELGIQDSHITPAEAVRKLRAELAVPQPVAGDEGATLQARVQPWMMACFGPEISADEVERGDRLLEEVFEALQSRGYDPDRVASLRDYVWSRPVGETVQEVGGVMITLAAFCLACGVDMHAAGETELARIWTKVEKIRAKQAAKPRYSPLPQAAPSPPPADLKAEAVAARYRYVPTGKWFLADDITEPDDAQWLAANYPNFERQLLYTEASLSAAHAAGKAEGEAEITRIRAAHALTEKDACDGWEAAGIRTQERNDWMHRAHDAHATARAEALQEAAALCAKHVSSDVWHNGGYMSTYLAERIRALIPAPLPPREENNG